MQPITPPDQERPNPLNSVITFLLIFLITLYIVRYFNPPKPEVPAEQGIESEILAPSSVPIKEEEGFAESPVKAEEISAKAEDGQVKTEDEAKAEDNSVKAEEEKSASEQSAVPAPAVEQKTSEGVPEGKAAEANAADTKTAEAKAESEGKSNAQWVTIGSMDPQSPYKMLLTFTSQGAALARAELNSPHYSDLFDKEGFAYQNRGYLGNVLAEIPVEAISATDLITAEKNKTDVSLLDKTALQNCTVAVVPQGTPAQEAGLKTGDIIVKFNSSDIKTRMDFDNFLKQTKPGDKLAITVLREGQKTTLKEVQLRQMPMSVIRPENYDSPGQSDPLSFLFTLQQLDDAKLSDILPTDSTKDNPAILNSYLNRELPKVEMRNGVWEIVQSDQQKVVFKYPLSRYGLEILKTYQLSQGDSQNTDGGYHLTLSISIKNIGKNARKTAYRLDGPTGLPLEGYWFTHKVWRTWSSVGLRDMMYKEDANKSPQLVSCQSISDDKWEPVEKLPLKFVGVDSAYFGAYLLPEASSEGNPAFSFAKFQPLRVGTVDKKWPMRTDCSFRAYSEPESLQPGEQTTQSFTVFIGPKKPSLLKGYGLDGVLYYGWFGWIAVPLVMLLHFFYTIIPNYGIAILLLTAVVRLAMHPLSRKQVIGAMKMQKLQPEMAKIKEKITDPQEQMRAQQALFKKHNYNPLSGCLVVFIQLPIFMALYRALMVDVELRQASMFGSSVRFLSNLAAPDMLLDWISWMPQWITSGYGMLGLGPYFNLLPIATIGLFIAQQKILMPPPADEQARMQQKVMNFMMIFMGLLFFKVAAGLCIYFIASSLWGLAERQFMPKEIVDHQLEEEQSSSWKKEDKKTIKHRPEDDEPMNVLKSWVDSVKNIGKPKEEPKDEPPQRRRRRR